MFILILFLTSGINLEQVEWESLLNSNLVYDIAVLDDGAWCGTSGGVRFFSLEDSAFTRVFTNKDGLPHNTCRSLVMLSSGELWVGTDRGLVMIDPASNKVTQYSPLSDNLPVLSLALNGDTLAVGKSTGVFIIRMMNTPGIFDDDDLYLPAALADAPASTLSWFKGELWIGSESGLRHYLPATDEVFDVAGLGSSDDVRDIDPADSLNVLTSRGLFRYTESAEQVHEVRLFGTPLPEVYSLASKNDTLYVTTAAAPGQYKCLLRYRESADTLDSIGFWIDSPKGPLYPGNTVYHWALNMRVVKAGGDGKVWVGLGSSTTHEFWGDGLVVWDEQKRTYKGFDSPGLNSNYVKHVLLDSRGNLWAAHWILNFERGVTRYSDTGAWTHLYTNDTTPLNTSTKVSAVDSKGRIVFGSWWQSSGVTRYDPSSGAWDEYSWGESVPLNIIEFLGVDPLDRTWVSHFNAERMSVLSDDFSEEIQIPWLYTPVYAFEFDTTGIVWTATGLGLTAYHPADFRDNVGQGEFTLEVSGNPVWDIVLDGSGGVWGVTSSGAFHWKDGETVWYKTNNSPLPENDLVAVDRDPWGRIYFLCKNKGFVIYDPLGASADSTSALWQTVSPDNAPLIPGFEYSWLDADRTGRVAVGTFGGGVSLLTMPGPSNPPAVKVSVYPNPCYASQGLPVRFTPLDSALSVTVYTLAGEKVKEFGTDDFLTIQGVPQAELDVTHLAAGLYIAVVRFPSTAERLKFVILR